MLFIDMTICYFLVHRNVDVYYQKLYGFFMFGTYEVK